MTRGRWGSKKFPSKFKTWKTWKLTIRLEHLSHPALTLLLFTFSWTWNQFHDPYPWQVQVDCSWPRHDLEILVKEGGRRGRPRWNNSHEIIVFFSRVCRFGFTFKVPKQWKNQPNLEENHLEQHRVTIRQRCAEFAGPVQNPINVGLVVVWPQGHQPLQHTVQLWKTLNSTFWMCKIQLQNCQKRADRLLSGPFISFCQLQIWSSYGIRH